MSKISRHDDDNNNKEIDRQTLYGAHTYTTHRHRHGTSVWFHTTVPTSAGAARLADHRED